MEHLYANMSCLFYSWRGTWRSSKLTPYLTKRETEAPREGMDGLDRDSVLLLALPSAYLRQGPHL